MRRATLFILAAGLLDSANAEICTQIADDSDRLACFDKTRACANIKPDSERLECFDSAYPGIAASAELYASPEEFAEKGRSAAGTEELAARIVAVTTNARKIDFLRLDNGHVWRENEDSRVRFEVGRKVKIAAGIFGSFNLTMEGEEKTVKVKRVE